MVLMKNISGEKDIFWNFKNHTDQNLMSFWYLSNNVIIHTFVK